MKQTQVVGKTFKVRIGRVAKTRMKQRILYNLLKMDTGVKKIRIYVSLGKTKRRFKANKITARLLERFKAGKSRMNFSNIT